MKTPHITAATAQDGPLMRMLLDRVCEERFDFPEGAMDAYRRMFEGETFGQWLRRPGTVFLAAREGERLQGFLAGLPPEGGVGTIMWLLVAQEARARGAGAALRDAACHRYEMFGAHKIKLTAPTSEAVSFYEHMGFKKEGFHPDHWWGCDFWSLGYHLRTRR